MAGAPDGDQRWFTTVALAMGLTLLAGLGLGVGIGAVDFPDHASAPTAPAAVAPDHVYFTITTSAATQYDTYYPANVSLPHGVPIDVTITCYDPGVNNVSSLYDQVIGTADGHALFSPGGDAPVQNLTALTPGNVSHTFTVTLPGAAGAILTAAGQPIFNVPLPPSANGIDPTVTEFVIEFPNAGSYVWRCTAPCDPYSMVTPGFMIGTISVS